jgi:putative oxidoreductase
MNTSGAASFGLLVLRFSGLILALFHGLGKVQALAAGETRFIEGVANLGFPAPALFAWTAALSELAGGLLVFIGLGTRSAAAFAAITMAVAAFARHRGIEQWLAQAGLVQMTPERREQLGNPEPATVLFLVFLTLVFTGAGRFSLDAFFTRNRD